MIDPRADCRLVSAALLDDAGPRPEGVGDHLASCAACRGIAVAHRAALRRREPPAGRDHPVEARAVLRLVRRRRLARAGGAVAAAAALLAALVLRGGEAPKAAPAFSVAALAAEVASYTDRDLAEGDRVLSALGPMVAWLAPPEAGALTSPPFDRPLFPWDKRPGGTP